MIENVLICTEQTALISWDAVLQKTSNYNHMVITLFYYPDRAILSITKVRAEFLVNYSQVRPITGWTES